MQPDLAARPAFREPARPSTALPVSPARAGTLTTEVADSVKPVTRRQALYALLAATQPGELLDWQRLGQAVGLDATDPRQRGRIAIALQRAIRDLEDQQHRSAVNERGRGYRILAQEDRLALAQQHQQRAASHIAEAYRHATGVDLVAMEPNVRRAFEVTAMALTQQQQAMRQFDVRQERLEAALNLIEGQQEVTEQTIDEMAQRLAVLEQRLGAAPADNAAGAGR